MADELTGTDRLRLLMKRWQDIVQRLRGDELRQMGLGESSNEELAYGEGKDQILLETGLQNVEATLDLARALNRASAKSTMIGVIMAFLTGAIALAAIATIADIIIRLCS